MGVRSGIAMICPAVNRRHAPFTNEMRFAARQMFGELRLDEWASGHVDRRKLVEWLRREAWHPCTWGERLE